MCIERRKYNIHFAPDAYVKSKMICFTTINNNGLLWLFRPTTVNLYLAWLKLMLGSLEGTVFAHNDFFQTGM